jgi:hypothetical protein
VFLVGTTLATYSAFRLVKHALELNKPVLMLNLGPTRADGLEGVEKIEWASGSVLSQACRLFLEDRLPRNSILERLLRSGRVVRPPNDTDDPADARG